MTVTPVPVGDFSRTTEPSGHPSAAGQPLALARLASNWVVILVGLLLSASFVIAGVQTVGLAWPVTHPEGAVVATVLRVRDGEPLYQNFPQFPHLIAPYPPLQPVV